MGVRPPASGRVRAAFVSFLLAVATFDAAHAATLPAGFVEEILAANLGDTTAMQIAPDGRLFIGVQGGQIRIWDPGAGLLPTPFLNLSVDARGERGLLGLAF